MRRLHGTLVRGRPAASCRPRSFTQCCAQADKSERAARFWLDPDERVSWRTIRPVPPCCLVHPVLARPDDRGRAGAIGWDFIEITPAQFLDRGVDYVSARADVIFREAMELDHCVVLLDEIDELIQQRTNEAETIERFFTTTMLPLAKLWDARRILFFVNTNNIERVDSAIVRSQRFDAARIFLPPGYPGSRQPSPRRPYADRE